MTRLLNEDAALLSAAPERRGFPEFLPHASPLVWTLAAILVLLVLPPACFLLYVSVHETRPDGSLGGFTLAFYSGLVTDRFFLPSLVNTLIYATGSAVTAIVLGTLQAIIVERTNTPGRGLVFFSAILALAVPHVLSTVAWLMLLGRAGPLNDALTALLPPGQTVNVYSMWGMILIEGIGFLPLTFLLMSAVLRSTDASFEEAAIMSGAGTLRTFWSITLRMGLPGLLALIVLVFVKAFESFEVPALVGLAGNINVLTTSIYQSAHSTGVVNYGQSGAYSVCLVLIVAGLLVWQSRLSRDAHKYQTITGKGFRPRVLDLGPWRYVTAIILGGIFLLTTVLPVAMLAFTSFQPFYEGFTRESVTRLSLENYTSLLGPGSFRDSILNTLVLGAGAATLVVPFTAVCAWLAARRAPGSAILDQLATLPLAFPAIILSVAFLNFYVNLPLPLYGTLLSVIIASSVRFLPYGMRYAFAGALQIHSDLEEAAIASGAGRRRVFLRIILPLLAPALINAWLLIFLMAVQAVSLPLLLVGPGSEVMAVTLFDLWQNGQVTELAAMGVVWIILMTTVSAVFQLSTRHHQIAR